MNYFNSITFAEYTNNCNDMNFVERIHFVSSCFKHIILVC